MNVHEVATRISVHGEDGEVIAVLRPIDGSILKEPREIDIVVLWRNENLFAFPSQDPVDYEGTHEWLSRHIVSNPDKILFFLETSPEEGSLLFGHMGLCTFHWREKSCEAFHILKGEKGLLPKSGVMTYALKALCEWAFQELGMNLVHLCVFSDNDRAIRLYERIGFKEAGRIPLELVVVNGSDRWLETQEENAQRFFTLFHLHRPISLLG